MEFLLYSPETSKTGMALAEELSISHGSQIERHPDNVIRWGNSKGIGYIPDLVINKKDSILKAVNKYESLKLFKENRILVPEFTNEVPCIARTRKHTRSNGLWFCYLPEHIETAKLDGASYFIKYIPFRQEWRIHVLDNDVPFIQKKYRLRNSGAFGGKELSWDRRKIDPSNVNLKAITSAIKAVTLLNLDFGAVDVIEGFDNKFYLLEVNTAPLLPNRTTRESYIDFFNEKLER